MKTSREYLEEALAKLGDQSDAKKAKALKVSPQALSGYRSGERIMDDFACILVANELGIDPLAVIYAANYDREKNVERKSAWEDFRKKLGVMGVAGLLVMGMVGTPPKAEASILNQMVNSFDSIYYVKYDVRWYLNVYVSAPFSSRFTVPPSGSIETLHASRRRVFPS